MTRSQFAFIVGVLLVWLAWDAGWIALAAIAAGIVGLAIVKVVEGELDLNELTDRFRSSSSSKP